MNQIQTQRNNSITRKCSIFSIYSLKKNNTLPLGGMQNETVLGGGGKYSGAGIRGFYSI